LPPGSFTLTPKAILDDLRDLRAEGTEHHEHYRKDDE
jgi:hypothetical protein